MLRQIAAVVKNEKPVLTGITEDEKELLDIEEIYYFDTVDRRTFAYTRDKTYQVSLTISALEEKLSDFGFIRINKANLVNIYQIKKIKPESNMRISAILRNDEKLQINRSYKRSFEEYLKRVRKAL
ncbi:MAG: LytTR family transcriptional regulator DNA-binding domain-containing protein [Eubacterium sp.]|nr:LytTR family transcriptional regulator DNA-binding domain-containing protein [Eubacterium sp.]